MADMRRMLLALVSIGFLLVPLACGDEEPEPAAAPATALTITVWPRGRGTGEPTTRTVECDADASGPACARLAKGGAAAFAPVADDAVCTEIYGGPAEAEVSGRVDGTPVAATLSRANGCEIARWEAVRAVVTG
jgi:hypothetical protein